MSVSTKAEPRGPKGHLLLGSGPDLILATIAQRFRLAMEPGQHVAPAPYITLRPEPGPRMRLTHR